MGRIFQHYLDSPKIYSCVNCRTHLACHDEIISQAFQGRSGKAFLFDNAVNVECGPVEKRQLMTGMHAVADIFCSVCQHVVGWKYEEAFEESQKYKEGKYIIEVAKIKKEWNE